MARRPDPKRDRGPEKDAETPEEWIRRMLEKAADSPRTRWIRDKEEGLTRLFWIVLGFVLVVGGIVLTVVD